MSTRGAIKIREKGEELRFWYGHDAYPSGLGHQLRRYLNMTDHKWSAMRIYNDFCEGKCYEGMCDKLREDHDFEPTKELGYYEEYGYLIDCDNRKLVCYNLPGYPVNDIYPDGNSNDDDWSSREVVELPYKMVSEEETSKRIRGAVAEYLFGREKPKPFGIKLAMEKGWTVYISVESDEDE